MPYTIYKSDGTPVIIADNTIDSAFYNPTGGSTGNGLGTQLVGRNAINYGAPIAQNFLQMAENFASNIVPSDTTSLQGQLWFNKTSNTAGKLYVRVTNNNSGGILNWSEVLTSTSGNAQTASQLQTARTIAMTGDGTWSVSFDGSTNVTNALTLATVNASPVGNQLRRITVNSKGLVTSTSAPTSGDITGALGYTPVNRAGDTMTGALILNADPVASLGAATKQYVDSVAGAALTANNLTGGSAGTIPYQTAANTTAMLPPGTAGYILTSNGAAAPQWQPASFVRTSYSLATNNNGAASRVVYLSAGTWQLTLLLCGQASDGSNYNFTADQQANIVTIGSITASIDFDRSGGSGYGRTIGNSDVAVGTFNIISAGNYTISTNAVVLTGVGTGNYTEKGSILTIEKL